jgi:hypothetical protein
MHAARRATIAAATAALIATIAAPQAGAGTTYYETLYDSNGSGGITLRMSYTDNGTTLRVNQIHLVGWTTAVSRLTKVKLYFPDTGTMSLPNISKNVGVAVGVTVSDPENYRFNANVDVPLGSDWAFSDSGTIGD